MRRRRTNTACTMPASGPDPRRCSTPANVALIHAAPVRPLMEPINIDRCLRRTRHRHLRSPLRREHQSAPSDSMNPGHMNRRLPQGIAELDKNLMSWLHLWPEGSS
ncbi:hypothetical protein ACP70R_033709 [Stipagrostis hirtigluma subsp. patula]